MILAYQITPLLVMANGPPNGPIFFAGKHAPKGTTSLRNYQIPLNLTTIFITIVSTEIAGFSEIRITSSHSNPARALPALHLRESPKSQFTR
ncbi:MAG: hypothetical protein Ct9H300mP8_07670 [Gammaproteobacteria bacterium]|nr:MAG: hypothetical protein Ct9H300mP8_07670 [Gammaproteobacteria bacterium]